MQFYTIKCQLQLKSAKIFILQRALLCYLQNARIKGQVQGLTVTDYPVVEAAVFVLVTRLIAVARLVSIVDFKTSALT